MAQGLTGARRSMNTLAASVVCLTLSSLPLMATEAHNGTASQPAPDDKAVAAKESAQMARLVLALDELTLPDEWDTVQGDTLAARFAATARAMRAKNPQSPTGAELMAQFENGGRPFFHPMWLNQPYPCPHCGAGGAEGWLTVVSVARALSVKLTAAEWHNVTTHGQAFPPGKLATLQAIFSPH